MARQGTARGLLAGSILVGTVMAAHSPAGSRALAAAAQSCNNWTAVTTPNPTNNSAFGGQIGATQVAALSSANIWAVGSYATAGPNYHTLVAHWNGKTWRRVPSANVGGGYSLAGISASSPTNVWAAGADGNGEGLTEQWNGHRWTAVPSRQPGQSSTLNAIDVIARADVWAVGYYAAIGGGNKTLVEHWNGKLWTRIPSPNPGFDSILYGLWARSMGDIWAVGSYGNQQSTSSHQLIEHWNGRAWKAVAGRTRKASAPSFTVYPARTHTMCGPWGHTSR